MNGKNKLLSIAVSALFAALPLLSCVQKNVYKADPAQADQPVLSAAKPMNDAYYHFTVSRMLYLDNKVPESLTELELAEQYDPSSAYLKYNLALMYMSVGRMNDALAKLEESIKTDPKFAPSYTLLGKVYASSQDPKEREKSVGLLNKAVELDPNDAESLLFLGIMDTEAGNYDSAEIKFRKITELYPDNERGYFFLGKLYFQKGDYASAEANYKKALDINPSFGSALNELAVVYEQEGKIKESEQIYKDVIVLFPHSLESYVRYGNFLFRVNRIKDARAQFEKAESLDVGNPDLKLRLGLLYIENGEYDKAIEEFRVILMGNPEDERAKYYLALGYIETGRYDTAVQILDSIPQYSEFYDESLVQKAYIFEKRNMLPESLALMEQVYGHEPNNEVIVNYLGNVYRKLGRNEDAINLYKKFLESNPGNETIYYSLGVTYYLIDQEDKSVETMMKLIEIDPKHADALNFVGYSYAERGIKLDEAESLIKKALVISPNKGYILDSLGWVYYKKGNYSEAIKMLKEAAALQSDDPAILEHIGDVYKDMGDSGSALEYYRKGVQMLNGAPSNDPDEKELRDRLQEKINQLSQNPKVQSKN